jgi:hypothetical protein
MHILLPDATHNKAITGSEERDPGHLPRDKRAGIAAAAGSYRTVRPGERASRLRTPERNRRVLGDAPDEQALAASEVHRQTRTIGDGDVLAATLGADGQADAVGTAALRALFLGIGSHRDRARAG